MLKRFVVVFAVVAGVLASPALAGQHDKDHSEKKQDDNKVCRSQRMTGSIMQQRICHTPDQWAAIDAQNSDNAQTALDKSQREEYTAPKR